MVRTGRHFLSHPCGPRFAIACAHTRMRAAPLPGAAGAAARPAGRQVPCRCRLRARRQSRRAGWDRPCCACARGGERGSSQRPELGDKPGWRVITGRNGYGTHSTLAQRSIAARVCHAQRCHLPAMRCAVHSTSQLTPAMFASRIAFVGGGGLPDFLAVTQGLPDLPYKLPTGTRMSTR